MKPEALSPALPEEIRRLVAELERASVAYAYGHAEDRGTRTSLDAARASLLSALASREAELQAAVAARAEHSRLVHDYGKEADAALARAREAEAERDAARLDSHDDNASKRYALKERDSARASLASAREALREVESVAKRMDAFPGSANFATVVAWRTALRAALVADGTAPTTVTTLSDAHEEAARDLECPYRDPAPAAPPDEKETNREP